MLDVLVSIIRCLYVPDFILFLSLCILFLFLNWRVGLLFVLSIVFFFVWRIKAPVINSRYCLSIQIFFIILFAFTLKIKQRHFKRIKKIIVSLFFSVLIIHFFLSFSGSRNNYLFYVMDDTASLLSHDKNASFFIEKQEYDRVLYSPQKNNQIVLLHAPQTHEDMDLIYYQYEFWDNNAYLIFSEKKTGNSTGTFQKCLYNSDTLCKKIRNYVKGKNKYISVYFHEKFLPSSFEDLKDYPALNTIICNGTLKSCSPLFDTYIYQLGNTLFWIVGADLQPKDEIIFHLFPPNREYLPPERAKYGFDNRGFRINSKYEIGRYGKYRLFERTLPKEYPIVRIIVGFNRNKRNITLFKTFHPSKY